MHQLFTILLILHISGGSIALLSGTINTIRRKGDRIHKVIGNFFLYGMVVSGTCALVMSVLHPSYLLFIVGIFTIYMAATGTRYLSLKGLADGQKPKRIDWVLTGGMFLFSAGFIALGFYHLIHMEPFGLVFITFGYISSRMVRSDIRNYTGKSEYKNTWLLAHIQRMVGAYIAAFTAFLVVNFPHGILPQALAFIPWLLPTAVLTPLIFKWSRKYAVKLKSEERKP